VLHRVQDRFGKHESSSWSFLWPLLRFVVVASRWLIGHGGRRSFDLIHVHNIPDFLVFAAWWPKWRGVPVILDIHDIVPEFFASKFKSSERSWLVRALIGVEKLSAAMADHVILANHLWLDKYAARSAPRAKCSVFINHVDDGIFRRTADIALPPSASAAPLIMFPGGLQWHQGLDIAIRAFAVLRQRLPAAQFHIYGDGSSKPELMQLAASLQLGDSLRFFEPLPLREIARVMATASLGVVPKRADSFGNEAYSTKIMEFMSVGVPVVVSSTRVDRHYFDDRVVRFFESGNVPALAQAMWEVLTDTSLRDSLVAHANAYVQRHSWGRHKPAYLRLVDDLVAGQPVQRELVERG
jgi:glycosyltransferase involved in cell wall biosynthesis